MDDIKKLKEKAYYCATHHYNDDDEYITVETQIEAMKVYALLTIAETKTTKED